MRTRLRTLRLRDVFMFVAVGAVVAIAVVVVGRELGVGRQAVATLETSHQATEPAEAPDQAESTLTLSLEAAPYCETGGGVGFSGSVFEYDDDGNPVGRTDVDLGYGRIAETDVRWTVTGGTAPYRLTIDNEPRDGRGPYEGATGVASVSCAPNPGEVFYDDYEEKRRYREDPLIDSGVKTIHAVVTDATGSTVGSPIDIYVILQLSDSGTSRSGEYVRHRLNPGKTYRYNGVLFTVPPEITIVTGGSTEGGVVAQRLHVDGTDVVLVIKRYGGEELYRAFGSKLLVYPGPVPDGVGAAIDAVRSGTDVDLDRADMIVNEQLDDFMTSHSKPPPGQ